MPTDKIKRSFVWLRKTLGIIDKTTLPGEVLGEVRPVMDLFGWDRLGEVSIFESPFTVAPGTAVTSTEVPEDVVRLVLFAAVRHTDPGVTHFLWLDKVMPGAQTLSLTPSPIDNGTFVPQGLGRHIILEPGSFLRGRSADALIGGALALDMNFIDVPIGEYVKGIG